MKILVATHKEKVFIHNEVISGIQVGAANADYVIDNSYYSDATGDNISTKNPNYNELTALYWMWKNLQQEDILGLVHYRRYFNFFYNRWSFKRKIQKKVNQDDPLILKHNNKPGKIAALAKTWLETHDMIGPMPYTYSGFPSLREDYCHHHRPGDWEAAMQVIRELYPDYDASIITHLDNDNKIYWANLFVAHYAFVDRYCQWLFPIFNELEKRITISDDPYQRRVYGFLSERLFTLYILHNKLKVKEIPTLLINEMFEKYKVLEGGGAHNK